MDSMHRHECQFKKKSFSTTAFTAKHGDGRESQGDVPFRHIACRLPRLTTM
jgi:hypothetical protein